MSYILNLNKSDHFLCQIEILYWTALISNCSARVVSNLVLWKRFNATNDDFHRQNKRFLGNQIYLSYFINRCFGKRVFHWSISFSIIRMMTGNGIFLEYFHSINSDDLIKKILTELCWNKSYQEQWDKILYWKKIFTFCESESLWNEGRAIWFCSNVRVDNSSHLINHCIAFNSASNFARLKRNFPNCESNLVNLPI